MKTQMRGLFGRVLCALALAVCGVLAVAAPALAVSGEEYTYTVRVFAGNQGTVNGKEMDQITGVKFGEVVDLSKHFTAVSTNDKYEVRGFRLSGQDNMDGMRASVTVTEDTDLVVSYRVPGDMVEVTLNFVEYGTGNALAYDGGDGATSRTFYAKVGDTLVMAAEYVPGYRPRANNVLVREVPEDGLSFDLEYIPLEEGETTTVTRVVNVPGAGTTTTTTVTAAGGAAAGGAAAGGAAAGGAAEGGAAAGGAAAGGAAEGGAAAGNEGAATTTPAAPPATEEIIDVDNPLAAPTTPDGTESGNEGGGEGETTGFRVNPVLIGISALALAALVTWFILSRKKKQEEEQQL